MDFGPTALAFSLRATWQGTQTAVEGKFSLAGKFAKLSHSKGLNFGWQAHNTFDQYVFGSIGALSFVTVCDDFRIVLKI